MSVPRAMTKRVAQLQLEGLWEHRKHIDALYQSAKNKDTRKRLKDRLAYVDGEIAKVRKFV